MRDGTHWTQHWREANSFDFRRHSNLVWECYSDLLDGLVLEEPKILELGCGSGLNSMRLVHTFGGDAVLLDRNDAALSIAKGVSTLTGLDGGVVRGDIGTPPIRGEYDLVHSEGVIEHFEQTDRVVDLHKRYCRRGGYVLIMAPSPGIRYSLLRAYKRFMRGGWIYKEEPISLQKLVKTCSAQGLEVLKYAHPKKLAEVAVLCRNPR